MWRWNPHGHSIKLLLHDQTQPNIGGPSQSALWVARCVEQDTAEHLQAKERHTSKRLKHSYFIRLGRRYIYCFILLRYQENYWRCDPFRCRGRAIFFGFVMQTEMKFSILTKIASFQLRRTGRRCVYSSLELSCLQYFSWFPQLRWRMCFSCLRCVLSSHGYRPTGWSYSRVHQVPYWKLATHMYISAVSNTTRGVNLLSDKTHTRRSKPPIKQNQGEKTS